MTEVLVGRRFFFRGPRRLLPWMKERGVARVIAESAEARVVHVEVLRFSREDRAEIDIAHLPVTRTAFDESFLEYGGAAREIDTPDSIEEWRRRFAQGDVGAFTVPIWKAAQLAWNTAEEKGGIRDPFSVTLQYAFPTKREGHSFHGVEIAVAPAEGGGNGPPRA